MRLPNMAFGGTEDPDEAMQLAQIEARELLKWDIAEAQRSIPTFTQRQRTALEHPIEQPDFGEMSGYHTGSPQHREIETHWNYDRTELETNVSSEFSGDLKARGERKKYQMASILTVDLDARPVWHASISWLYNPTDEMWQVARWRPWMNMLAENKMRALIPNLERRSPRYFTDISVGGRSLHVRAYLDEHESRALRSMRSDIVVPVLH